MNSPSELAAKALECTKSRGMGAGESGENGELTESNNEERDSLVRRGDVR